MYENKGPTYLDNMVIVLPNPFTIVTKAHYCPVKVD
jgi:hypothetical protein